MHTLQRYCLICNNSKVNNFLKLAVAWVSLPLLSRWQQCKFYTYFAKYILNLAIQLKLGNIAPALLLEQWTNRIKQTYVFNHIWNE